MIIRRPAAGEDSLHAFGVVYIATVALIAFPEADTSIVGSGDELFACRTELDVHDGADVVFENVQGALEVPHVEYVYVVVFVCEGEVEGFHWIPTYGVGGEGEYGAVEG